MAEKRAPSLTAIAWALRGVDSATVALTGLLAYYLRFGAILPQAAYLHAYLFVSVSAPFVFQALSLYDQDTIGRETLQFRRLGLAVLSLVFFTLAVGFLTKTTIEFSRIWISLWGLLSILVLVFFRIALWIMVRRWQAKGWMFKRIALVGTGPQAQHIVRLFSEWQDPDKVLIGVFDDRRTRVPNQVGGCPVRGTVEDLLDAMQRERIDEVIIALPWSAESRVLETLQKLRPIATHVRLAPTEAAFRLPHRWSEASEQDGLLGIYNRPISNWSRTTKFLEDQIVSAILIVLMAPIFSAIAVAVKLSSPGPLFTRAARYDFMNRRIELLRFRTHVVAVGTARPKISAGNKASARGSRLTRVGRFLRRARLHELPEFLNVLRGEMSVVGPEPRREKTERDCSAYERIAAEYFARHNVKPGITGWAQVHGWVGLSQAPASIERRIEYDVDYVDRWSIWFDLLIIVMTPFAIYTDTFHD